MKEIAAVVLAAGGASRMGRLKQLLPVGGQPMVRRATEAVCAAVAADGGQVVVVVGAQAEAVAHALDGLPVEVIVNEAWAEGLSASIRAGLRALRPGVRAALMVLADQPGLTPDLLRALAARYQATGAPIVAPMYQGRRGNPVLFDRALFAELEAVEGDQGGRALIARYQAEVEGVQVDDPAVLLDVDTPQDLEKVQGTLQEIEKLRNLRHLIIDLDGVLYRGEEAIPGAGAFIEFLREQGIGFVLATNNSTRTPQQFVDKLAGMGVRVYPDEVLTSALATAGYLKRIAPPGARVFVVGQEGLWAALREAGLALVEEDAEYVVAGMDVHVCYERLAQASLQVRAGARFIGTNPDRTYPSERGIVPGAGAQLAFLEAATGVTPTVIGKPETAMLEQALARLGASPPTAPSAAPSVAMLGDRLETDILAGQRAGLLTILVLSGVTDRAMLAGSEIQPDLVFEDVGHLRAVWQRELAGR